MCELRSCRFMGPSRRHASQRPLPGCRSHFDLHRFSWKLSGSYPSVLTGWLQWPVSVGYSGQGELNPCHNHSVILGSLFAALLCVCQLCGQDTEYQKLSIRKCHVMLIYCFGSKPNFVIRVLQERNFHSGISSPCPWLSLCSPGQPV